MKGQAKDWEKMFPSHVSNKGPASRTCKELLQLNNNKVNQKNGQKIWIAISPKRIYLWLIIIWKNAQHLESFGKCKLKPPQWVNYFMPTRMAVIKQTITNVARMWRSWNSLIHRCKECKMYDHFRKQVGSFLKS